MARHDDTSRDHDRRAPEPGPAFERGKRAIDIVVAVVGLVLFLPLLAVIAAWIRLLDGGPVFYSQWRVGRNGWLFRIHKIRTMVLDAEERGVCFAADGDPRILPLCGILRRSHIDELPQLWNILRGDMSLVGPRPERPEMFQVLRPALPAIEARLACRPGLTGLAQVRNGYTNDIPGAQRKLAYDLEYLQQRSLRNDLKLMLRTVPKFWDATAL